MEQNVTKGQGFLKVTGILMIIFGSISLITSLVAIFGVAALDSLFEGQYNMGMIYFSCVLMLISAIAEFVTGIIGVANCKKPEKAKMCMAFGIVVAALCVIGTVCNAIGYSSFGASNIFSLFCGLVLPVLFIIGATKNKAE